MPRSLQDKLLKKKLKINQEKKSLLVDAGAPVVTSVCNGTTEATFAAIQPLLSKQLYRAIEKMGFTNLTEIQKHVFDVLLDSDSMPSVKAIAKTGSGKTLAYLLPLVQMVSSAKLKDCTGTVAFVLTPTRELGMQVYGVLCDLLQFCGQKAALVKGGGVKKNEAKQLSWGASIVVGTPGRLVDHLYNTEGFVYHNFCTLVIDEADRLFDLGFEREMKKLLTKLAEVRPGHQTLLFSATDDARVREFSNSVQQQCPILLDLQRGERTVQQLQQEVLFVASEDRLFALYCLLDSLATQKVMVFVNSWTSIDYYERLLTALAIPVISIHGQLTQEVRTSRFNKFNRLECGLLLCTDIGARGWDVSNVDVIIQYDPPDDPSDYIHRVGRTARVGRAGRALVFLREGEAQFVHFMAAHGVHLHHRHDIDWQAMKRKHWDMYAEVVLLVRRNSFIRGLAIKACNGFVRSYKCHRLKYIYDANTLNHNMVAQGFLLDGAAALKEVIEDQSDNARKLPYKSRKAAHKKYSNKKPYRSNNKPCL